jgi:hypothetical protein
MTTLKKEFNEYREKMNEVILGKKNLVIKSYETSIRIHMKMARLIEKPRKCWVW